MGCGKKIKNKVDQRCTQNDPTSFESIKITYLNSKHHTQRCSLACLQQENCRNTLKIQL